MSKMRIVVIEGDNFNEAAMHGVLGAFFGASNVAVVESPRVEAPRAVPAPDLGMTPRKKTGRPQKAVGGR